MARHRFQNKPFDEINLTPLIDTLFFLLIIFMLTAPLLEYKMEIHPPAHNADNIKPDDNAKTINIRKDGIIILDNKEYTLETITSRLNELRNSNKKYSFFLRGDEELRYGQVISTLRILRNAGFPEVSLVTSSEE